jgi:hypothetical protein
VKGGKPFSLALGLYLSSKIFKTGLSILGEVGSTRSGLLSIFSLLRDVDSTHPQTHVSEVSSLSCTLFGQVAGVGGGGGRNSTTN